MKLDKLPTPYYYISIILFMIAIFWGYFTFQSQLDDIEGLRDVFQNGVFQNISPFWLFVFIFINNAFKAFLVIIFGILLGLFPLYFIYVNGVLIGATIFFANAKAGPWVVIAGLLPHGILEIPALIIAISYGLWLGVRFVQGIFKVAPLRPAFQKALSVYWKLVLPLLFVGALIEAYITPIFIRMAIGR